MTTQTSTFGSGGCSPFTANCPNDFKRIKLDKKYPKLKK